MIEVQNKKIEKVCIECPNKCPQCDGLLINNHCKYCGITLEIKTS